MGGLGGGMRTTTVVAGMDERGCISGYADRQRRAFGGESKARMSGAWGYRPLDAVRSGAESRCSEGTQ